MAVFEIGKKYNFKTLAPEILGDSFEGVETISILNASMASNFRDIYTLHEQLKSVINLPLYADDCTYVAFTKDTGENFVLAIEWIDLDSIVIVDTVNIRIELKSITTEDINLISSALREIGYTNFTITKF